MGSDDQGKVYLNGKEVVKSTAAAGWKRTRTRPTT